VEYITTGAVVFSVVMGAVVDGVIVGDVITIMDTVAGIDETTAWVDWIVG
jgi:hypothetical protein